MNEPTGKVFRLHNARTPAGEQREIIDALERAMVKARAGELTAVAVAYYGADASVNSITAGRYSEIITALATASHDLMRDFTGENN